MTQAEYVEMLSIAEMRAENKSKCMVKKYLSSKEYRDKENKKLLLETQALEDWLQDENTVLLGDSNVWNVPIMDDPSDPGYIHPPDDAYWEQQMSEHGREHGQALLGSEAVYHFTKPKSLTSKIRPRKRNVLRLVQYKYWFQGCTYNAKAKRGNRHVVHVQVDGYEIENWSPLQYMYLKMER